MFFETNDLSDNEIYLKLYKITDEDIELGYVPAYHFYICRCSDHAEMGRCDLRIGYNSNTYFGGNAGYEINEQYRGNHYAGKACKLLYTLAKKHHMSHLIITCSPNNTASRKTCEYAGCHLMKIAALPEDNVLYQKGDREKCIYCISFIK